MSRRATEWHPLRQRSATLFRPSNPYSSWRTCSNPYLARAVPESKVSTGAEGGLENGAGRDSRLWRRNASSLKTTASLLWATRGARLDPSADRSTPLTGGVFSCGVHQVSGDYGVDSALMRYRAVGRLWSLVGLLLSFSVDQVLFFSARRQSSPKAAENGHGVFEAR